MICGLFSFASAKKAMRRKYAARGRRNPVWWKAEEAVMNASKDDDDKDRETMMSLFGNTSIEPTNWSSLTVAFGRPSFRWWISLCFPDPLHQLLTDTHKQMGQNGGAERWWGGYWKGSSGWQLFFLSFLFFFFGWIWLTNFLAKESRHWSWQPGSYHQLVKRGGEQPQWHDTTQWKQEQANAMIYDLRQNSFNSMLHVKKKRLIIILEVLLISQHE